MPGLAAVLLAAGSSRRLGQPKQLVKLDGETLVRRTARLLSELGAAPIVVVTGYLAAKVAAELHGLPLTVVSNSAWNLGMGGSIACGVQNIPEDVDGVLLMVCDQWRLELKDLVQLKTNWETDISRIALAEWKENNRSFSGPPVIFPSRLIHELKVLDKGAGARPVINRNQEKVSFVRLQNAAWDLDNPAELERLNRA